MDPQTINHEILLSIIIWKPPSEKPQNCAKIKKYKNNRKTVAVENSDDDDKSWATINDVSLKLDFHAVEVVARCSLSKWHFTAISSRPTSNSHGDTARKNWVLMWLMEQRGVM